MQVFDVINNLFQTGSNRKTAVIGTSAEKYIKVADSILVTVLKITIAHCELIEVTEHRQIEFLIGSHTVHLFLFDSSII